MTSVPQKIHRCTRLMDQVQLIQDNVKTHTDNFGKQLKATREAVDNMLKQNGMTTLQEYIDQCKAQLTEDERKRFEREMQEIATHDPSSGAGDQLLTWIYTDCWLQGGIAFVQAMRSFFKGNDILTKAMRKEYIASLDKKLAQTAVNESEVALRNMVAEQKRAVEVAEKEVAHEGEVLLKNQNKLKATRDRLLQKNLVNEEKAMLQQAEKKEAEAVERLIVAQAEKEAARVAMRQMFKKGIILIGVGLIIFGGVKIYEHYAEEKDQKELKEFIAYLATARLYAKVAEKMVLSYVDLPTLWTQMANAIAKKNEDQKRWAVEAFQDAAKANQEVSEEKKEAMKREGWKDHFVEKEIYDGLIADDKRTAQNTSDDPDLRDMIERHKKQLEEAEKKVTPPAN